MARIFTYGIIRSQYEKKTKTSLQWLVDLLPKALSCTQGLRLIVFPDLEMRNYLQPLLPRSQFAFARYLFILTKKSFCRGRSPKTTQPYPLAKPRRDCDLVGDGHRSFCLSGVLEIKQLFFVFLISRSLEAIFTGTRISSQQPPLR